MFLDTLVGRLNFQPLGLLAVATATKAAGHEVLLSDMTHPKQVFRDVEAFAPDVIAMPTTTGPHKQVLSMCARLKSRFEFHSVIGGPHPTFFPQIALRPEVDAVCRGEADVAFVEYLNRLEHGDPSTAPNMAFERNGELVDNPPMPLIPDIDELPQTAWEILDPHPMASRFPVRPFISTRGCPYQCSYCYNANLQQYYKGKGKFVRRMSPGRFVSEIESYKKRAPISFVYIFDDTFAVSNDWLDEFCEQYKKRIDRPFFVDFTARLVTAERIAKLQKAGLAYCGVGLESGDETVRQEILCKKQTDEHLRNAADVFHKAKLPFEFFSMLGLPATDFEKDLDTFEMNRDLKPTVADVMIFQPYPGTPLGDKAKELGLFSGDPDDLPPTFKSRSILNFPHRDKVRRLMFLFRILVMLGASRKTAKTLASLPLTPLYWLINRLVEGFTKSRNIYRIKVPLRDYLTTVYHFIRP